MVILVLEDACLPPGQRDLEPCAGHVLRLHLHLRGPLRPCTQELLVCLGFWYCIKPYSNSALEVHVELQCPCICGGFQTYNHQILALFCVLEGDSILDAVPHISAWHNHVIHANACEG